VNVSFTYREDDTIRRKVNTSDASAFADICGCCPSRGKRILTSDELKSLTHITVWGVIWLIIAFIFFGAGIIVGLAVFKVLLNAVHKDESFSPDIRRKALRSKRWTQQSSCLVLAPKALLRS
jgi:hypothetical protein